MAIIDESLTATDGNPFSWYVDSRVLDVEYARVFRGTWQYVGHVSMLSDPGSYITQALGGRIPIVVVRGEDGGLRGFLNACRHRGARIVQGEGRITRFMCPYHAWTYALDGALVSAPYCNLDPTFERSQHPLVPVAVDTWGPFVFANTGPDPHVSLADWLGPIPERLARNGIVPEELVFWKRESESGFSANWKIVAENWPECYHCAPTHRGLSTIIDINPTHEDRVASPYAVLMSNPASAGVLACKQQTADHTYDAVGPIKEAQYGVIFPNTVISVSPGQPNLSLSWLVPVGPERTLFGSDLFFGPDVEDSWIESLMDWYHAVGGEDDFVCTAVQHGAASGHVPRGRLMPTDELVVVFQRWVSAALSPHLEPHLAQPGGDRTRSSTTQDNKDLGSC